MNNFSFYSPTYFAFGKGEEKRVPELVLRFGGSRVLLVYGGGSIKKSGLYASITDGLKANGIYFSELSGVKPNPRSGLVYEGIKICKRDKIDFILAIGGGSVIDTSKAIAAGAKYDGDFWDFFRGERITDALPVGTVLTISAAGSEGSPNTVITNEATMQKWSAGSDVLRPKFSVLNPEFTCTLPAYQTASGATDIIMHICERYFSNTDGVEVTDRLCEALFLTMIKETPVAIREPKSYDARANIMWAGMLAHNNVCGVGREQDWASHTIEHELSSLYDVAHGAGLAVVAPAWMKYVMTKNTNKFLQFAVRVWGCQMDFENPEKTMLEGIDRFEKFLRSIGMPATLA
ncbi:MAG: iron-containing alcohol dehydrogenase, partial [Clostridia bacterium]|nr:iron-containing alcohol dehydrogenase [Clostridia bacterium]